jgi:4-hydroxybenzoate polyprenyltransferase
VVGRVPATRATSDASARRRSGQVTRALLLACHPAPTAAVTLISVLVAIGVGVPAGRIVLLGLAVLTGQLSIGWSNDRIDARRDAATGRADKPAAVGAVPLRVLDVACAIALVATVVFSLALGWRAAIPSLLGTAAGWAYNLGLKSTIWSGLMYVVCFGGLPAIAYLASPGHPPPPWWAVAAGALLGVGAHLANVLPDLLDDATTGVRGLPHRLGPRACALLMPLLFAAAAVALVLGPPGAPSALAWVALAASVLVAVAAAWLGLRRPRSPVIFYAALAVALLDVLLFVFVV